MINFDPSSPQLNLVKQWFESYISLDTDNTDPLLSKNFRYESFPKSSGIPDQSREEHLEIWGTRLSSMDKLDVSSIQQVLGNRQVQRLTSATSRSRAMR